MFPLSSSFWLMIMLRKLLGAWWGWVGSVIPSAFQRVRVLYFLGSPAAKCLSILKFWPFLLSIENCQIVIWKSQAGRTVVSDRQDRKPKLISRFSFKECPEKVWPSWLPTPSTHTDKLQGLSPIHCCSPAQTCSHLAGTCGSDNLRVVHACVHACVSACLCVFAVGS